MKQAVRIKWNKNDAQHTEHSIQQNGFIFRIKYFDLMLKIGGFYDFQISFRQNEEKKQNNPQADITDSRRSGSAYKQKGKQTRQSPFQFWKKTAGEAQPRNDTLNCMTLYDADLFWH